MHVEYVEVKNGFDDDDDFLTLDIVTDVHFFFLLQELSPEFYNSPLVTAQSAAEGLTVEQKSQARVFDVAAGTGMCGQQVKSAYRNLNLK